MCGTDKIIQYLREKYRPESIIVYGSFADGSAGENSDFDALVIADCECAHDASVMEGTVLDVFVSPPETFLAAYDPEEFVQTFDGEILLDERGIAAQLKSRVCDYIAQYPQKTEQEIFQEIAWCEKMFLRTKRGDTEGYYRWHGF